MPKIIIVNRRNIPDGVVEISCYRPNALSNPFRMVNSTQAERDRVCGEYDVYFKQQIQNPTSKISRQCHYILELMLSPKYKNSTFALVCYCYPRRCHTETIKAYLEDKLKELQDGK